MVMGVVMLFIPSCLLGFGSKKTVEKPQPEPPKMGDYFKFFYCNDCGHAVHNRDIKNVECCSRCGSDVERVAGRWLYEWKNNGCTGFYVAVKFHPKVPHETTKR